MRAHGAPAVDGGRSPKRRFPAVRRSGILVRMEPHATLAAMKALAALPLLAFLPLVILTLLAPLRAVARRPRS